MSQAPTADPLKATFADCAADVKPGAKVWTDPMPSARADQVEFFKREGFLIVRSALSPAELAELDGEINRIALNHQSMPRIREGFDLEPRQDARRAIPTFRKIGGITELSPAFDRAMRHPNICGPLHDLLGPVLELYRDVVMMKPARVGREKPWHQDSVYWPWQPMNLVSAMTALDDAGADNGGMQVIPRTHTKELQHYGKELQVDIGALQDQTAYVPLRRGDTLLFHSLLLHGSEPNRSDQDRRVLIISYKTPDLKYIGKGEPPPPIVASRREA